MQIVFELPPMWKEIEATFPTAEKECAVFAYGNTIYNPWKVNIAPQIMAHEQVHSKRQGSDPAGWWHRYLDEPQFRLDEEIAAHQVEWQVYCHHWKDRNAQARYLNFMKLRLASPLYGGLISPRDAGVAIRSR